MIDNNYFNKVENAIKPFLKERDNCLTHIASKSKGVSPIDIIEIFGKDIFSLQTNKSYHTRSISFPEPNPVDFEWRFTKESSVAISKLIDAKGLNVGCFGVPSVYYQLIKNTKNKALLFDINPFLKSKEIKDPVVTCDLNKDPLEGFRFDIIIMDPPWYIDSYLVWFKQAINNLKEGGRIYTTIIPALTRPNVEKDWSFLLNEFKDVLSLGKFKTNVTYETPFFELESFDTFGIGNIGNWRNTELVEFQLIKQYVYNIQFKSSDNWKRFKFGYKMVSIIVDNNDNSNIEIESPYEDGSFTLKSVSNRDEARRKVNFITSRNKVLIIKGTRKVESFLNILGKTKNINDTLRNNYTKTEIENLKLIYALIGA